MTESILLLAPEQLTFDVSNPRFAGLSVDTSDPKLYGSSIEQMRESMIAYYGKTGSLLIQPIVVVKVGDKYSVRAGYTRAVTFVSQYKQIKKALGKDVKIAASVVDKFDETDAITENVVRTEQHFISVATTIHNELISGKNLKTVAKQLGMSVDRVKELRELSSLEPLVQELCLHGRIGEGAAIYLSTMRPSSREVFINRLFNLTPVEDEEYDEYDPEDYDEDEDVDSYREEKQREQEMMAVSNAMVINTAKDAAAALSKMSRSIVCWERYPQFAFTIKKDDGTVVEFPDVEQEPWFIIDDLGNPATLDMQSATYRVKSYWFYSLREEGIELIDERIAYYNYTKVEKGTHPSEIAVWKDWEMTVYFYVKSSELYKTEKPEYVLSNRMSTVEHKTQSKNYEYSKEVKTMAIVELMKELMEKDDADITFALEVFMQKVRWEVMDNGRDMFKEITGFKIDDVMSVERMGYDKALKGVILSVLARNFYWGKDKDKKKFFEDNGIDFDEKMKATEKKIEANKLELKAKAEDKKKELQDKQDETADFVVKVATMRNVEGYLVLDMLKKGEPVGEAIEKYIAKVLVLNLSGTGQLRSIRVASAIEAMVKSYKVEERVNKANEQYMTILGVVSRIYQAYRLPMEFYTAMHMELEGMKIAKPCDNLLLGGHYKELSESLRSGNEQFITMALIACFADQELITPMFSIVSLTEKGKVMFTPKSK